MEDLGRSGEFEEEEDDEGKERGTLIEWLEFYWNKEIVQHVIVSSFALKCFFVYC